eukprot:538840-Pleurochrysis_carterae.AAC.1
MLLQSKTSEAQAEAFRESLRETAALLRDVGITEAMEPRILNFAPVSFDDERPGRRSAETTRPTTTRRARTTRSPTSSRRAETPWMPSCVC